MCAIYKMYHNMYNVYVPNNVIGVSHMFIICIQSILIVKQLYESEKWISN